mmetsp:Transcript_22257/g.28817  ORF Transcript_22257/g.28817 Transcript_22257/m.28817 type:complete len:885 (-) Transcript_22257:283-2937(-)
MSENAIIEEAVERDVRPLISLIDSLRGLGIHNEVQLPQICVVGDQSSGKSSVLASISGLWLPRGSGLVTRCPVQVQMRKNTGLEGGGWRARASLAGSQREETVPTPQALSEKVSKLMEVATAGTSHGLSQQIVTVDIESPTLPDLTLIDLPGIIRTRVGGQDSSVLQDINSLINSFMAQEATIILAVVPANQDIATAEVLERASACDPAGVRTLAVLTKPDLIGLGNEDEVKEVVTNKRKPLRLGYVMVKNNPDPAVLDKLADEEDWFSSHSVFSSLDRSLWGFKTLTTKLTALLATHIQQFLPHIKYQLQAGLSRIEAARSSLGGELPNDATPEVKKKKLVQLVSQFIAVTREACRGEYRSPVFISNPELRVRQVADKRFQHLHNDLEGNGPSFGTEDFLESLQGTMENLRGRELPGLFSSQIFYGFMADQVEIWRPKVESCKLVLQGAMESILGQLCSRLCCQYPHLITKINGIILSVLRQLEESIIMQIDQVFERELDPFTASDDLKDAMERTRFARFDEALERAMNSLPSDASKETAPRMLARMMGRWYLTYHGSEMRNRAADMTTVLEAYWQVSSKRVTDNCCMIFETNLLTKFVDWLEMKLLEFAQTTSPNSIDSLFYTDPVIAKQRQDLENKRAHYTEALQQLDTLSPGLAADPIPPGHTKRPKQAEQKEAAPQPAAQSVPSHTGSPAAPAGKTAGSGPCMPERRANAANDGSVAIFEVEDLYADGGMFRWMGTRGWRTSFKNPNGGLCRLTSSGMMQGSEELLLEPGNQTTCIVEPGPEGSFVCVDLGRRRALEPVGIKFVGGEMPWVAEGSGDSQSWVQMSSSPILDQSNDKDTVTMKLYAEGKRFRYLRIKSTEVSALLDFSSFEFAGKLYAVN